MNKERIKVDLARRMRERLQQVLTDCVQLYEMAGLSQEEGREARTFELLYALIAAVPDDVPDHELVEAVIQMQQLYLKFSKKENGNE